MKRVLGWAVFFAFPVFGQREQAQLPIGQAADLVLFGRPLSGDDNSQPGIEWDEPREFTELRATFKTAVKPEAVNPEVWVSLSSSHPPGGGQGGWTLTDTPWNGSWKPIQGSAHIENGVWVFHVEPESARRTLKVRLRFNIGSAPDVTKFEVFGPSRWNVRDIRIETGCENKPARQVEATAYDGRIAGTNTDGSVTHLRVIYLEHYPDSNDRTVLRLRAGDASFGVSVDDVMRHKAIYVRDFGVLVADEIAGGTFATYMTSGRLRPGLDVISRTSKEGDQSLERAFSDIPALSMRNRSGRHPNRYVPVGIFANREKYGIEFNGNLFISKRGSKVFPEEQARMEWSGDELTYRIGTGLTPDFRERERSASQSVADNDLPIVLTNWTQDGLEFHEEAFSTLLDAPLETWKIRGDETSVLLVRLAVKNSTAARKQATVWLHVAPQEQLVLQDGFLLDTGGRVRVAIKSGSGALDTVPVPPQADYKGSAVRWRRELAPGESVPIELAITFRTLHDSASLQRLTALNYDRERERVRTYWAGLIERGAQLHVPDETLNRFYRSVLQHILLSVQRDVPTGLYMDPCGTYDYNMFANETDIQVRSLDMRGLPELAEKFLEPFYALQGSKAFPGKFHDTSAILHGVRVDADHDYTSSGYNLNHGWTLWTGAEHYLFTRDKAWLQSHLQKMIKAADWIISERRATMREDENGKRVWEYGLLPPGQLEDNEEWQYWFAVNAYAYRGLRAASEAIADLDGEQGRRLASEASKYREDIRQAAFRSMAETPAVELGDGTWVPAIGTRTHLHGRDIGWIRNILYGPQVLIDCGVLAPDEAAAGWILRDMEDNLFMARDSFSVAEQDWFSRGGMTLQPNLVNNFTTYLMRDEIPQALRAFYNTFAVSYYPDVNMFSEWVPSFGRSGGPFFKTSDEAAFLAWLRQMLVREQGDTLYLASGAPRAWFGAGRKIEFTLAPTYFGQVSLAIEAHPESGRVDATVNVPPSFRGKHIQLRLRSPENRRIARVEIDGRPWTDFDAARDQISLPLTPGSTHVRAFF
jgi:hypothetical protein